MVLLTTSCLFDQRTSSFWTKAHSKQMLLKINTFTTCFPPAKWRNQTAKCFAKTLTPKFMALTGELGETINLCPIPPPSAQLCHWSLSQLCG